MTLNEITYQINGAVFEVNRILGPGFLEKVYENGLFNRLQNAEIEVKRQIPLKVRDEDGTILGNYVADLFIEQCLLVELKASSGISNDHIAQILGYMRACNVEHGMIINFGAPKLEIRKFVLT